MQVNSNISLFNRFATRILFYGYIMLGPGSRDGFIYGSKANVGHLTVDLCIIVVMFKSIPYIWLMLHEGF